MKTIIQTPTPNLDESISFYGKLNFEIQQKENGAYAIAGSLIIDINTDRMSRAGIKFCTSNSDTVLEGKNVNVIPVNDKSKLVVSPTGCPVYFEDANVPAINTNEPVTGNFMGLSLETSKMDEEIVFWEKFDFKQTAGNPSQGWVSLTNSSGFGVSLMNYQCCPHLFFNPSLTFFNGENNLKIIDQINNLNIAVTEEITVFNEDNIVDNIIIRDPGGLGYFLFSD